MRMIRPNSTGPDEPPKKTVAFPKSVTFMEPEQRAQTSRSTTMGQSQDRSRTISEDDDEKVFFELYHSELFDRDTSGRLFTARPRTVVNSEEEIFLQREMGLYSAINFLVTISLGTGIYFAPPVILDRTGSTTEALIVWLFCGFFALLVAITYGELVCVVSQSGESFSYLLTAFSPISEFFGPLPAFLNIWYNGFFLGPAQVSLIALLLAEQLYFPVTSSLKLYANVNLSEPIPVKQFIAMAVLGIITCINLRSIKTCVRFQHFFGVFKIFLCIVVIGSGSYSLIKGSTGSINCLFKDMKGNTTGIIKAIHKGMWTYEGWNYLITLSEEINDPIRIIPLAVLIGIPLVIFLITAMNVAFLSVLTASEIKAAPTKFIYDYESRVFGNRSVIMPIFFAVSALSSAMCIQLGMSRTCFAAGREGHMIEIVTYLDVRKFVPTPALIIQALLSCVFILSIPLLDLIEYFDFLNWSSYGFAFVALIILRVKMPDTYRIYKLPLFIPIILTSMCILVTVGPLFRQERTAFYIATAFSCLGVYVYHQLIYKQKRMSGIKEFNKFVRALLGVAPPTALPEGYTHTVFAGSPTETTRSATMAVKLRDQERYYTTTTYHATRL